MSKTQTGNIGQVVCVRLKRPMVATLRDIREADGVTIGEQIRRGLEMYIAQKQREHSVLAKKGVR